MMRKMFDHPISMLPGSYRKKTSFLWFLKERDIFFLQIFGKEAKFFYCPFDNHFILRDGRFGNLKALVEKANLS